MILSDLKQSILKIESNNIKDSSIPKDHSIQTIQLNSNTSKYSQILSYNEFLKDENFNLRMSLEKQKVSLH